MRTLLVLSCLLCTSLGAQNTAAQTPAGKPPATQTPPPTQTPPAPGAPATHPPVRRRPAAATPVTVTLTVTESGGAPIGGVKVSTKIDGEEKETQTTAGGIARFLSMKPGEYRVRFERDDYISLERDITVKAGAPLDLTVALSPAPAAPVKAPEPVAASTSAPAGDARALSIVDFLESNRLSGKDPVRSDQLGCTASAKTTLLQIRDELEEKAQPTADEVLYVVAGEGNLRLGNKDVALSAGGLAIVPRGTVRGLSRKGKNPLMVLSVLSGMPCTGEGIPNSK
jgi:mannose-6-phosphate isomerase-like protein (cupin superfamily)